VLWASCSLRYPGTKNPSNLIFSVCLVIKSLTCGGQWVWIPSTPYSRHVVPCYSLCNSVVIIMRINGIFHENPSDPRDIFCTPDLRLQGCRIIQVGRDLWRSLGWSFAQTWVISEVQSGLEDHPGQRRDNLSHCFDCACREKVFPYIQVEPSFNAYAVSLMLLPYTSVKTLALSSWWPVGIGRLPLSPQSHLFFWVGKPSSLSTSSQGKRSSPSHPGGLQFIAGFVALGGPKLDVVVLKGS